MSPLAVLLYCAGSAYLLWSAYHEDSPVFRATELLQRYLIHYFWGP